MTDRASNLKLNVSVDQSLAAQGIRALHDIQAATDAARASILKINDDSAKAIADLRAEYVQAADAADKFSAASKATKPPDPGNAGQGGVGSIGGLRRTGSALTQLGLGDIGRPVQLAGDIQQVVKEFDQIGNVTKTMIPALAGVDAGLLGTLTILAPLAVVAGAVAAGTALWNQELEQGKQQQDEAIGSIKAYYAAIEQGTTTSIASALDKAQSDLKTAQDIKASLEAQREQAFKDQENTNFGLGDFGARVRTALGALGEYNTAINDQSKTVIDLQSKVDGLTKAYGSQAVAANDLAEATLKSAEHAAQTQIESYKLLRDGSSKQIQGIINDNKDKVQAFTNELTTLQAIKNPTDDVKKRIAELYDQIAQLSTQSANLTQNVLGEVKAREAETQAVKDAKQAHDEYSKALTQNAQVTVEISKIETERQKQVEDNARTDARAAVEQDYAARIAAAKEAEGVQAVRDSAAQTNLDAETKLAIDKAKIVANEQDSELKAYQTYIDAEKNQTSQANRQRLQTLETAQNDLKNLAAAGDVAGFVTRSNQAKLDLKHQTENASAADKQLYDNYQKQIQAARDAQAKQLSDLTVTFQREKDVRDKAAAQRIAQLEASGKDANNRSAQLEQELNNIREQWRKDNLNRQRALEEQNYEDRLNVQRHKQAEILAETVRFFDQWLNAVQNGGNTGGPSFGGGGGRGALPTAFATGITYVPHDNYLARLDQGERVLTRRENNAYTYGQKGGDGIRIDHIEVNATVGDVATKSFVDQTADNIVGGVVLALKQAKGRGN